VRLLADYYGETPPSLDQDRAILFFLNRTPFFTLYETWGVFLGGGFFFGGGFPIGRTFFLRIVFYVGFFFLP